MVPLRVYGSAVYRLGTGNTGGAFESVHETTIGFTRVRAYGVTKFSWSSSNACEVGDVVAVMECPWYARGSCISEPVAQRENVLSNLVTLVEVIK